ncbi:hypothetical protein [Blastococcus sp. LR1]|uniref:hypothetical protein n=1 Tax=Blastococcus sp. LR1 TaxID=2877000 RepID=UPI001CCE47DC|nr:hypothetical protein [Blastococcus sp. LR1]MCA0143896.1 hypothetical protein [Blastococcus sp. LR1]
MTRGNTGWRSGRSTLVIGLLVVSLVAAGVVVWLRAGSGEVAEIGRSGGIAGEIGGPRVEVPGGVAEAATITIDRKDMAPDLDSVEEFARLAAPVADITVSEELPGAVVRFPLPEEVADPALAFLAVYGETEETWIPLPTVHDAEAREMVAEAPHFSRFGLFVLDQGIDWVGQTVETVRQVGEQALDGVVNSAGSAADRARQAAAIARRYAEEAAADAEAVAARAGSACADSPLCSLAYLAARMQVVTAYRAVRAVTTFVIGVTDEADCDRADPTWRVQVPDDLDDDFQGCVVREQDGSLTVRVTNHGYVRYLLMVPPPLQVRFMDLEAGVDTITMVGTAVGQVIGGLPVPAQGHATMRIPAAHVGALEAAARTITLRAVPDALAIAMEVGLTGLAVTKGGKAAIGRASERAVLKAIQEAFDRETPLTVREAIEILTDTWRGFAKDSPLPLQKTTQLIGVVDCVSATFGEVQKARADPDPVKLQDAGVNVARRCLRVALDATRKDTDLADLLAVLPTTYATWRQLLTLEYLWASEDRRFTGWFDVTLTKEGPAAPVADERAAAFRAAGCPTREEWIDARFPPEKYDDARIRWVPLAASASGAPSRLALFACPSGSAESYQALVAFDDTTGEPTAQGNLLVEDFFKTATVSGGGGRLTISGTAVGPGDAAGDPRHLGIVILEWDGSAWQVVDRSVEPA